MFFFAQLAIDNGVDVVIFTDTFRLDSKINNEGTLRQNFASCKIEYIEIGEISVDLLSGNITPGTIGFSLYTFWIFRPEIIKLFNGKLYNFHGAVLPMERGGGAVSWRILTENKNGGFSIHTVSEGIDTGDIVLQNKFIYPSTCQIPQDFLDYNESKEKELLNRFFNLIINGKEFKTTPQMESESQYWPLLNTNVNGYIDWTWRAKEIELFINAFDDPYPGAITYYNEKKIHLKKCFIFEDDGFFHPFQSGIIYRVHNTKIFVAARGGTLGIGEVFDEYGESICGEIKVGNRFFTPIAEIEEAKCRKIAYNSEGLRRCK